MSQVFGSLDDRIFYSEVDDGSMSLLGDDPKTDELPQEQFRLFNLLPSGELADPHETDPNVAGNDAFPDVRLSVQLVGFNPGARAGTETRATVRLDIGQSASASNRSPLYWSIAAGLDLVDLAVSGKSGDRFGSSFDSAFVQRPIDVPGGLADLRFEVVCHAEPAWWKQIFGLAGSGTGASLMTACGFPGVSRDAVKIIDKAFDELSGAHRVLFKSKRMTFALSARARDEFALGMAGVQIGCINRGFCVLAPQQWYQKLKELKPRYLGTYGVLIPASLSLDDFLAVPNANPLSAIPYAVLKVNSKSVVLG
jgi:hypothetical protein